MFEVAWVEPVRRRGRVRAHLEREVGVPARGSLHTRKLRPGETKNRRDIRRRAGKKYLSREEEKKESERLRLMRTAEERGGRNKWRS